MLKRYHTLRSKKQNSIAVWMYTKQIQAICSPGIRFLNGYKDNCDPITVQAAWRRRRVLTARPTRAKLVSKKVEGSGTIDVHSTLNVAE